MMACRDTGARWERALLLPRVRAAGHGPASLLYKASAHVPSPATRIRMDQPIAPDSAAWPLPFAQQEWEQTPPAVQAYVRTMQHALAQLQDLQERVAALEARLQQDSTTSPRRSATAGPAPHPRGGSESSRISTLLDKRMWRHRLDSRLRITHVVSTPGAIARDACALAML